jgi:hypothetical protein
MRGIMLKDILHKEIFPRTRRRSRSLRAYFIRGGLAGAGIGLLLPLLAALLHHLFPRSEAVMEMQAVLVFPMFYWFLISLGYDSELYGIAFALWLVGSIDVSILGFVIGGIVGLIRGRAKRRRAEMYWLCRRCGYDVRESTGKCPECGTPII